MPLQHCTDNMLKAMRRGITRKRSDALIDEIRNKVPEITLRTTLISGFPGETEADFEEMKEWVAQKQFDRLGIFNYSHEENTHAYKLVDDVPDEVKQFRADEVMDIQSGISLDINQQKVGKTFKVLFDRVEGDYFVGRTEADSPEVDNEVLVPKENNYIRIGDFADIEITKAEIYDLYGRPIG